MRYPPSILDDIRARLPVSGVVGKKVRLKKAGREWKGLSPFNAEKSPSFFVNDQKGFYHCFSSGKHGDIFTFLMETEGASFPEAVERLAAEAGVVLPQLSPETEAREEKRKSLYEVMELAASFFEAQLKGKAGAAARDYLARRELQGSTARFRLGYSTPERFALRDHLAGKGVSTEQMIEAGLLVSGDDIPVPFDRFRDRVMFPINDAKGRVIAFGGRALSADVPAKYLNSPDTPLFNKGECLYNLDLARKAAHERGGLIAVEGYVDVIALDKAGFPNAVAPLGTALTEQQLALLWRVADEPILCFDGDKAGRRAAFRALDLALPAMGAGKTLRFALLPEGQDPDDLLRYSGAGALERVLNSALPLIEILWSREMEAGPLDTPERRAGMEERLREALKTIRDETLRRYYKAEIEQRLQALQPARPAWRGGRFEKQAPKGERLRTGFKASPALLKNPLFSAGRTTVLGRGGPREALILSLLAAHPELLIHHGEALAHLELLSSDMEAIRAVMLDSASEQKDVAVLNSKLHRAGLNGAVERLHAHIVPSLRWVLDPLAEAARVEETLHQALTLHHRSATLNQELRQAERALAEDNSDANLAWLRAVQEQLASLQGTEADVDSIR